LSWNHFLDGFKNPSDGINLGFHELTHAISLENRYKHNYAHSFISAKVYRHWRTLAKQEMEVIKTTNDSLFRKYASVNLEEFLAVCVEVFFEKPNAFKQYHPKLFVLTCKLLNQYPSTKA
jgi:Mlc titration factor MtfA (ptsG expression regulator)